MKSEVIIDAMNCIDEKYKVEALRNLQNLSASPCDEKEIYQVHRKAKKISRTALIAAVLATLLVGSAFAVWSIHSARQQELREDMRIDEKDVNSYVEFDLSDEAKETGVTLLSTVNDGETQRVFVNVSPVEKEELDRLETVSFAWRLDGMTVNGEDYWMTATPKMRADTTAVGHDAVRDAILRDAYDESTKTLTLQCFIHKEEIAQAQAFENGESVHLTVTLWDHHAQADAGVGSSDEWLRSQKSFGSVWFTPTENETRYFDFNRSIYHDEELDKEIEIIGLELTPFSAVWKVHYEGDASFHTPEADWDSYKDWAALEDKVCIESKIIFSNGTEFSTGGALTAPYKNGVVEQHCDWGGAINIDDVQRIVLDDLVLWENK
ncbi:MAG: hypothetical protein Q4E35_03710 [Eubacteriales bacterium]|nr:hypothetical protein [Eubacteriales bacterium]